MKIESHAHPGLPEGDDPTGFRMLLDLLPEGIRLVADEMPFGDLAEALRRAGMLAPVAPPTEHGKQPRFVQALERSCDPARRLREAARGASMLLVEVRNGGSAASLLASLSGTAPPPGLPLDEVERWFAEAGLRVRARIPLGEGKPSRLAGDLDASLRRLFQEVNPDAAAERVVYLAEVGDPAVRPEYERDLLSVVVRNHSVSRLDLLDEALFSLATQGYRPIEVLLSTQATEPDAPERFGALLERYRGDGVRTRLLHHPSAKDIRGKLVNEGIAAAQGRYLAFLDDDDVVYPDHYTRLVDALRAGDAAWAVAKVRRAFFTRDASGALYCTKKDLMPQGDRYDLARLLRENYIACHAYVLDRERLGRFRIAFSEEVARHEDYQFLIRLAALFRPAYLGGRATCEYRMRDDGTNSIMLESHPHAVRVRNAREWQRAHDAKERVKEGLQLAISVAEMERELDRYFQAGRSGAGLPAEGPADFEFGRTALRYRLVDAVNDAIKRFPGVHQTLKVLASRRLR